MRILMVCMTDPKDGLKGDTKLVRKRREVLEEMDCIVDVLYFEWSWFRSSIKVKGRDQSRAGVDIVVRVRGWRILSKIIQKTEFVRDKPIQTWVSVGLAEVGKKRLRYIFGSYGCIHFFHIRSVGLWRLAPKSSRLIVDLIDSYTLNLGNRIEKETSWIKRVLLRKEYKRIKDMETNIEQYVVNKEKTAFVAVAEADLIRIGKESSERVVVPVGIDRELPRKSQHRHGKLRCIFFGNLNYEPNIRACNVIECVAKVLREKGVSGGFEITVAGRNIGYFLKRRLERVGVRVLSPVEDMYELVKRYDLAIMPMVSGSGMQSKVLEAIAWGVVVLTTERAARPVGLVRDSDYIEIEAVEDIVESLMGIADGRYNVATIRENAYEKIAVFEWKETCRKLISLYGNRYDKALQNGRHRC